MIRALRLASLLCAVVMICRGAPPATFENPPAPNRILKIIHSWPDEPAAQELLVKALLEQGFGGVVCNVSFDGYLQSDSKWKAFTRAVQEAKRAGLALWLYDEKGYPSGAAGGLVLKHQPDWQARGLLVADHEVEGQPVNLELPPGQLKLAAAFPAGKGRSAEWSGWTNLTSLVQERKLSWTPPPGRWHVLAITEDRLHEGTHASMSLSEHIPYPNLLDSEPTAKFIKLTHEAYTKNLGSNLGNYFVATFTDEPSLMSMFLRQMPYRVLPWSSNLPSAFHKQHGYDINQKLPELVLDLGSETSRTRHDFWQTVGTLVSENFFGQIQDWCHQHQIQSGGHLLMEENLVGHVPLYGDFFQCLRRLDVPSIDCLTSIPDQVPWFIARLAGSAADLEQRSLTMCETSDHSQRYRPAGDKRPPIRVSEQEIRGTCNRLIVSGINKITSYYSFDGLENAQLRRLNEYVGRCCSALQGGHQVADIAVLYPVESIWTRFTPARLYANDSPGASRIESAWRDVSESLFSAGREFTYIDSRALVAAKVENGTLVHGNLRWRIVVLPLTDTLPLEAWRNLSRFVESGGVLLSIGALPANSETEFPSQSVETLTAEIFGPAKSEPSIKHGKKGGAGIYLPAGLASLVPDVIDRILEPQVKVSARTAPLRYTHRRINNADVFFVINDSVEPFRGKLNLAVAGTGERCDPTDGSCTSLASGQDLDLELPGYGSIFYRFAHTAPPVQKDISSVKLPALSVREVPAIRPTIARGEFVREQLGQFNPQPTSQSSPPNSPLWRATASLTKSDVDTFLFLRFEYQKPQDFRQARALVLDSWVPENQRASTQLLTILHEKSGADYLASSGRFLSSPGHERTWIALDRFQLAGWSKDPNGKLDLEQITEIRIGWGGYLGKAGEEVVFAAAPPRLAGQTTTPAESQSSIDLRPAFDNFSLPPRTQGARPTCSVFTVVGALEYAAARRAGETPRLSVEFLNWAANKVCGAQQDGGFFSDLWKGFERYGICAETTMPYTAKFDTNLAPSDNAFEEAKNRLQLELRLHWIKEWNVNTGLSDLEFSGIKQALQQGWPVCGGFRWPIHERWESDVLQLCPANAVRDGHSVLLVGYRDDASQPGGGLFIFRNTSGRGRDGLMPYAYAQEFMNDALWIDHTPQVAKP